MTTELSNQINLLGLKRIDFDCCLTQNAREWTTYVARVHSKILDFIDQQIHWFRQAANEDIIDRPGLIGLHEASVRARLDFECYLTPNDCILTMDELEVLSKILGFIDERIEWLAQRMG